MRSIACILLASAFIISIDVRAQKDSTKKKCEGDQYLGIVGSVGANLIRGQWAPVIDGNLSFTRKENFRVRFGVQCNYFTGLNANGENLNKFTNFVSAEFWKYKAEGKMWSGGGIAYLITDQADIFKDHTAFKIYYGSAWKIFELHGNLYFSDNFKTFFPGFTVMVGMP